MSSASKRVNTQASGQVFLSLFLVVLNHSAPPPPEETGNYAVTSKEKKGKEKKGWIGGGLTVIGVGFELISLLLRGECDC